MEACVTRNKLGGSGQTAKWKTMIELGGAQRSRARQAERSAAEQTSPRGAHIKKESATCVFNETISRRRSMAPVSP